MEEIMVIKAEGYLRVLCTVFAAFCALVVGFDTETKEILFKERQATFEYLHSLKILVIVLSTSGGYHLLQSCRCFVVVWLGKNPCRRCNKLFAWACLLLDNAAAYATFSLTVAAAQDALVAIFSVKALQWDKICNIYPRFCWLMGCGGIIGVLLSVLMAGVSCVSAYHLFRLYPSDSRYMNRVARWSFY